MTGKKCNYNCRKYNWALWRNRRTTGSENACYILEAVIIQSVFQNAEDQHIQNHFDRYFISVRTYVCYVEGRTRIIYAGKQSAWANVKIWQEWCEQFRIIYDGNLHNLYRLPHIRIMKSMRFWWDWYVVRMWVTRDVLQKLKHCMNEIFHLWQYKIQQPE
jgi:hypothetical protein